MKILITGSSRGIGRAVSLYFLEKGFEVVGIDLKESTINHPSYTHFVADISKKSSLPKIGDINFVFNNAGLQNCKDDISNNLKGTVNVTEKYAFDDSVKAVLFNASSSARSGYEFPEYVASKAGIVGYMKNVACRLAKQGTLVNSLSLGGVITESNALVMENSEYWNKIMDVTPLKKWMTETEVAEWVYFLLVTNKSMSGQDILVDNGELNLNSTFVWPE